MSEFNEVETGLFQLLFQGSDLDGDGKISGTELMYAERDVIQGSHVSILTNGKGLGNLEPGKTYTLEQLKQLVLERRNS
ncbi:MAG: hypothetical protein V7K47_19930 [Nostoc sp.]